MTRQSNALLAALLLTLAIVILLSVEGHPAEPQQTATLEVLQLRRAVLQERLEKLQAQYEVITANIKDLTAEIDKQTPKPETTAKVITPGKN